MAELLRPSFGRETRARPPAPARYAELATATNFSFLRGASHPQEMVAEAARLGLAAIGIADRNTLAGVVRAYVAAKEHPALKLIVGARVVTTEGFEAIAYPLDRQGYGDLCGLLSLGKGRAPKGECHLGFADLLAASSRLVLLALPPEEGPEAGFEACLAALAGAARRRCFLAAAALYRGDERRRLGALAELGQRLGAPLVAVSDALYHHPARRPLQDVLTCIREGCTLAEAGLRLERNAERHLRAPGEMARLFAEHPGAVERTLEIAEACRFSLGELSYEYPEEPVPPGKTAQQHLEELTWRKALWRYGGEIPEAVAKQLAEELRLIGKMEYAPYFLTVHDVVTFAQDRGILCQGRGSAANSAVCYCLGITAVDPQKSRLLFARFISENRNEPPDIDVDFEHERRELVMQNLYERYGRERAAIVATVIHYRPRMAIREVGKVLGLTPDVTAAIADTVWGSWGDGLPDEHVRQAGLDPDHPPIRQALDLAQELIGFPRHLSQHVGGFVLSRVPISQTVPIGPAAMEGRTFIEWDKDDIDAVGLMKVDVLALGMLTTLKRALAFLNEHHGTAYETLADLPQEEDEAVYDMLCRADSVGVFQVESRAQMSMLPRLKPRCFYDLVVEVAIVRPGPIQGDMVHPYLRRRELAEPVTYPAPSPEFGPANELQEVLGKTFGVPLFQEQAMEIAIKAAGFSPAEADGLRRAMATFKHVGKIHQFEEKFVEGMCRRGYPRDFAERCFKQIKGFSTYGFPESHAASFALLVYASAWIKCHHPDVFLAALLNSQPMGFYQPAQLVRDAREHGVEVRPVDVNLSGWDATLEPASPPSGEEPDGREAREATEAASTPERPRCAVRIGFRQVKGLSEAEIGRLVAARGSGFASVEQAGAVAGVSRHTLERLAEADAFRSIGLDRRESLWRVRGLDDAGFAKDGTARGEAVPLLGSRFGEGLFPELPVRLRPMPLPEHVAEDYGSASLSLKAHPIAFFRERLRRLGAIPNGAHRDEALRPDARVAVSGLVLTRQRPGTAKGVMFLTLEDETGTANVIVWPKLFEAERRIAMSSAFLVVRGRIQRASGVTHVLAEAFLDLTGELRRLRGDGEPAPRLPPAQSDVYAGEDSRLLKSRDFH